MQVYSYNSDSLHFNGLTTAHESPLEPGVFHYPANSTDVPLPEFDPSTQTCKFHNGKWVIGILTSTELPVDATTEEIDAALAIDVRQARDAALRDSDWLVLRHQEEVLMGDDTTLSQEQWNSLLGYRKALREMTSHENFPRVMFPEWV